MSDAARKLAVFPAFHKVAGRRVVIVGGGVEAAAKIRLLSETRAEIVVFAATLDRQTGADLIAVGGDWRGAWPALADLAGAALVFAATGTEERDRGRLTSSPPMPWCTFCMTTGKSHCGWHSSLAATITRPMTKSALSD